MRGYEGRNDSKTAYHQARGTADKIAWSTWYSLQAAPQVWSVLGPDPSQAGQRVAAVSRELVWS